VVCTYKKMTSFTYSVGQPIANVSFFVMDPSGKQFVPVGVIGELYIGGAGVGRGYLNKPELNARHFIRNPWAGSGKIYCSGDLVRRLPAGELEFIGRKDGQVKVRGFRVELGEIETRLLSHPSVTEAAVTLKEQNGVKRLVAYYVGQFEINSLDLREFLEQTLPTYMVPNAFIRIPRIPLTNNGKLDVRALPLPPSVCNQNSNFCKPKSEIELAVVSIWAEVLGLHASEVGIFDNFFSLGGDSISALLIAEKLKSKFSGFSTATVNGVINYKTVRALIANCMTTAEVKTDGDTVEIFPKSRWNVYQFSSYENIQWVGKPNSLQEGFVSQFLGREEGDDAYAVQVLWLYKHELDPTRLEQSWRLAYSQFPGLRVRFDWSAELVQIVDKPECCNFDWRTRDWRNLYPDAQMQELEKLRLADRAEYFDLAKGNLLRVYLIHTAQNRYFCLTSNHHAILDGWSSSILFSTVHELYVQLVESQEKFGIPFQEDLAYFKAQEQIEEGSLGQTEFFVDVMGTVDEGPDFLSLSPVPERALNLKKFNQNVLDLSPLSSTIHSVSTEFGLTLNTFLQFTWHQVLRIFLRMNKTVVGTTVSGRTLATPGITRSVGLFINTLPLVVDHLAVDELSLVDALETLQGSILELNSNSAGRLRSLHRPSQSGLPFESLFVFENFPEKDSLSWEKHLGVNSMRVFEKLDFPLVVTVRLSTLDSIHVTFLSSDSFEPSGMSSLLQTFHFLLSCVLETMGSNPRALCTTILYCPNPNLEICSLPSLVSITPVPSETLVERFKRTLQMHRDAVAIVSETRHLTYRELNNLSDSLALHISKLGGNSIGRDKFVALFLEKSEWTVVSILGVLKTGSAYVPIDTSYPELRVRQILQDSQASILIINKGRSICSKLGLALKEIHIETACEEDAGISSERIDPPDEDANPFSNGMGSSLAYVIYTSGTSGDAPKGCLIEHHSVINLVDSLSSNYYDQKTAHLNPQDSSEVILQLSAYVYDLSVLQIWFALLNGHTILIPTSLLLQDLDDLTDFMAQNCVTHVSGTPSLLKLISWDKIKTLKRLVLGGEMFDKEAWATISKSNIPKSFRVINEYGPTETTVSSSFLEMKEYSKGVGSPIANTFFYIMDEHLRLLPNGVIGELLIGGRGLARGYLNRPELNIKKFVESNHGQRLYRTGDLARRMPDGTFELIGRIDSQVKIRGNRMELGEIEHAMREIEGITDVIVLVKSSRLLAYYVSNFELGTSELRNELLRKLPPHVVPSVFVQIEKIPLAITGKVDVRSLPDPDFSTIELQTLPSTKLEKAITLIWSKVLKFPFESKTSQISIDGDFFSLGGDSLLFMQMLQRVRELTGVKIRVVDVYREKTIQNLIWALEKASAQISDTVEKSSHKIQITPAPCAAKSISFHLRDHPDFELFEEIEGVGEKVYLFPPGLGGAGSYIDNLAPLLRPRPLVLFNNFYEFLHSRFGLRIPYDLVAREYWNEIKKLQPVGPFYFVGWSWGGVVAFEISRQMAEEGFRVDTVFIIDSLFCLKRAVCSDDGDRMNRENDVSYHHDPPITSELGVVKFVLFKATHVSTVGNNLNEEDDALDQRIYSHYVHETKANYLDYVLPPQTSLAVIPFTSNHFNWFEDPITVKMIGRSIIENMSSIC